MIIVWLAVAAIAGAAGYRYSIHAVRGLLRGGRRRHGRYIEAMASEVKKELVEYEYRHGRTYEPRAMIVRPHDLPPDPTADHEPIRRRGVKW